MQQTQMHEMTINPIKKTQSLQVSLFYSNQTIDHVDILTRDFLSKPNTQCNKVDNNLKSYM